MRRSTSIKDSQGDKVFLTIMNIFLLLCLIVVLYPLIYVVSASFSSPQAVITGKVWLLPVKPTLMGYEAVFKNNQIITGFANSFFYMIVGTIVSLAMTLLAAYPLSRKEFSGRNVISIIFIFTMLFSGGLIPSYLLVKNLGLVDSRWALIIPSAMSIWNVIIARTYMQTTIPDELYESAQLDGCNDIRFFISIVLPLSIPVIAVLALYYGVWKWNTYYEALIYLKTQKLYPLQIILRNILILSNTDPTMVKDFDALIRKQGLIDLVKYSVIVVASVPVLLIYPFVQKYFLKGVMVGALKG
jgi:putative aldouronate transport system permease protein